MTPAAVTPVGDPTGRTLEPYPPGETPAAVTPAAVTPAAVTPAAVTLAVSHDEQNLVRPENRPQHEQNFRQKQWGTPFRTKQSISAAVFEPPPTRLVFLVVLNDFAAVTPAAVTPAAVTAGAVTPAAVTGTAVTVEFPDFTPWTCSTALG